MTEPTPGSWTESMSGRERVRHVVELLDEPTPVHSETMTATVTPSLSCDYDREIGDGRCRRSVG